MTTSRILSESESAREVMRRFFVPIDSDAFLSELDKAITACPSELSSSAASFRHNLAAVMSTVSVPVQLAMASARHSRFGLLHAAERIRARDDLGPDGQPTEQALRAALSRARQRMAEETTSASAIGAMASVACEFLLEVHNIESVAVAAAELLRQGTILIWGTFEVLCRDLFVAYVNARPNAAERLAENSLSRRYFQLKSLSLELPAEYGYNLSENMGEVLESQYDPGNLPAIRSVFRALFPDDVALANALGSDGLWTLSQRRHLIVHRRGIVDERYLRNTSDVLEPGCELPVPPNDIEEYLGLVRDVGMELLRATGSNIV